MATTQTNRIFRLEVESLGPDVLVCTGFEGTEGISQLYSFQVTCASERPGDVQLDQLLGKGATISCALAGDSTRYVNGIIRRCAQTDRDYGGEARFTHYSLEIVPWIWQLTKTMNCRVFQDMTFPDIIKQVLNDRGFSEIKDVLANSYTKNDYCVQYRETDMDFIARLMEEVGMFYFFEHEAGKHTLVLGDSPQAIQDCPGHEEVKFDPEAGYGDREHTIRRWRETRELLSGKMAFRDHHFQMPSKSLDVDSPTTRKIAGNDALEVYDYPGKYARRFNKPDERLGDVETEGQTLVKLRMEAEEYLQLNSTGESDCRGFVVGTKFKLDSPPVGCGGGPYLLLSVSHSARQDPYVSEGVAFEYSNTFCCGLAETPYRPPRITRRPFVQGPQTAVVVGPAGEEIYPDRFGRVKVQFHWDREGKFDENSSCWVRVSQIHAGKGFGGIDIPRVGDEVIVAFLEGDPDQPIICGRVYNSESMPPFPLPDKKTISGMKTKTYQGGGYNELIMDDTPGNELIRVHGQFDMDSTIEHDLREHVFNDRSRDVTNNETIQIGNDLSRTVANNATLTVGQNRTRSVGGSESVTVAMTRDHTVGINETIAVGGAQEIAVGGMQSVTVGLMQDFSVGGSQTVDIGGDRTTSVGKTESVKAGKTVLIEAGDEITLKTGSASIVMKKNGDITISGKNITVKGTSKITAKASSTMTLKGSKILQN